MTTLRQLWAKHEAQMRQRGIDEDQIEAMRGIWLLGALAYQAILTDGAIRLDDYADAQHALSKELNTLTFELTPMHTTEVM